jgi:DNA-binding transcriptional regulator YdaS (Cro superfamily)
MTIAEYLAFTKMSVAQFAELVAVDQSTVNRWMNGKTTPEAEQCDRIVKASRGVITLEKILEPIRRRRKAEKANAA